MEPGTLRSVWGEGKPTALPRAQWSSAGLCAHHLQIRASTGPRRRRVHVCVCVCAINCLQAGEGESSCAFPMKDFILKKENWFCSIQKW